MRRTWIPVAALALVGIVSCGGSKAVSPVDTAAAREEEELRREKEREDRFEMIALFARQKPEQIQGIRRRIREFIPEVKGSSLEDKAERLLQQAEKSFEDLCNAQMDKTKARLKSAEAEEDYDMAVSIITAYPRDMMTPDIQREVEELTERYQRELDAANDFLAWNNKVSNRIRMGETTRARATIIAFIENPRYKGTAAARGAENDYLSRIAEKEKEKEDLQEEEATGWESLFDGEDDSEWDFAGGQEFWSVQDRGLVVETPADEMGSASIGTPEWKDYTVEFRFKRTRGDFSFGARGQNEGDGWGFDSCQPPGPEYDNGQWYEIRVEVMGTRMTWIRKDTTRSRVFTLGRESGPLAFQIFPNSKVEFKGIRIKHQK